MDKDIILEGLKNEIDHLNTRLDELRVQAKLGEKEIHEALKPEMKLLENNLIDAQKRLSKLADTSAEALKEGQKGLEGAFKELKQGFERAFDRLKDNK